MIRARFASALALAAFLAVPAFAQTDSNSRSVDGATVTPLTNNSAKQSAAAPSKQMKADATTSSTTSTAADVNSPSVDGAHVTPLDKNASKQSAASSGKQAKADSTTKSTTSTAADVNSRSVDGATVAPLEKNSAKQQAMADCADHPNAGKLADKSTGMAKEHSASPVHSDCVTNAKPAKVAKKKSTKTASSETK